MAQGLGANVIKNYFYVSDTLDVQAGMFVSGKGFQICP